MMHRQNPPSLLACSLSLTQLFTRSLSCSLTRSLTQSFAHSLTGLEGCMMYTQNPPSLSHTLICPHTLACSLTY